MKMKGTKVETRHRTYVDMSSELGLGPNILKSTFAAWMVPLLGIE